MRRLSAVAVAIAVTATGLAGCSEAKQVSGPNSGILPAVQLPVDSRQYKAKDTGGGGEAEFWEVPLSYTKTKEYIAAERPIGRTFDGAPYEGEESGVDKSGNEETQWTWRQASAKIVMVIVAADSTNKDLARVVIGIYNPYRSP